MVRKYLLFIVFVSYCLCIMIGGLCINSIEKYNMQIFTKISYIDSAGNIVIDASDYIDVGNFSNDLAAVRTKEGLYGFIDKSGSIAIRPQFIGSRNFSDGLAAVKLHEKSYLIPDDYDKWGYIDKTGNLIFETDFDALYDFSEGIALARKGNELFFIGNTGQELLSLKMDEIQLEYSGNQKFSEGLLVACDVKTKKCGFIDKTGKFVIAPKFHDAGTFSEGLARVSIIENHRELLGFINHSGEYVILPKFDIDSDFRRSTTDFSEGYASLVDGTSNELNFLYINKGGEIALRTTFIIAGPFKDGLAVIYDAGKNKYGYMNKSGKLVIPAKYNIAQDFSEGLAIVEGG